jgi:hypothetical protein
LVRRGGSRDPSNVVIVLAQANSEIPANKAVGAGDDDPHTVNLPA